MLFLYYHTSEQELVKQLFFITLLRLVLSAVRALALNALIVKNDNDHTVTAKSFLRYRSSNAEYGTLSYSVIA